MRRSFDAVMSLSVQTTGSSSDENDVQAAIDRIGEVAGPGERNARILSYFRLHEHRLTIMAAARLIWALEENSVTGRENPRVIARDAAARTIVESLLRSRYYQLQEHEVLHLFQFVQDQKRRDVLRKLYPARTRT